MTKRSRQSAIGALVVGGSLMLGCGVSQRPAALAVSVQMVGSQRVCAAADCQIAVALSVSIQETSGREVALQSVSAVLCDTRGMQDMHAAPAELSQTRILSAAGATTVAAGGQLNVPYVLGFSLVQPYILGPMKAIVHVRGVDSDGNQVDAETESN